MKTRTPEQKQNDLNKGYLAENKIQPKLKEYFNENIIKDPWNNALIDFFNENKTLYIELKSRRFMWGDYPDVMIGKNKLDYFRAINKQNDKEFYFCVNAYNGNYIAKLDCSKEYRSYDKNIFIPCGDFVKF